MSNTDCPSPCVIYVYYDKEIEDAVRFNPELQWLDFQCGWDEINECQRQYIQRHEEVVYWFCPKCGRVYEESVKYGRWIRVYRRTEGNPNVLTDGWKTIYIFPDVELDPYTEDDITVKELMSTFRHKYSYKISPDETLVLAYDKSDGSLAFCYELEEKLSPSEDMMK